jgi:chorismate synthase
MSGSTFGKIYKLTSFGESHGLAMGGIIEGMPSGVFVDEAFLQKALDQRAPGRSLVSPRKEKDTLKILSGVFENKTTGAPIAFIVENQGFDSTPYDAIKHLLKPGHAQYTYLEKYGIYDHRGSGRASARETLCRVVAGAFANLVLKDFGIQIESFLKKVGPIDCQYEKDFSSDIFCFDSINESKVKAFLENLIKENDSCGGIVGCKISNSPVGLGEPVFDRFEARLAYGMLSIPATKGFSIGEGFSSTLFKGSEFNDHFCNIEGKVGFTSNHAGGTLGGITTGQEIDFEVAFKPTSSIKKAQETLDLELNSSVLTFDPSAKHDPCVAIRGVPVVKAMAEMITLDFLLLNKLVKHSHVACN